MLNFCLDTYSQSNFPNEEKNAKKDKEPRFKDAVNFAKKKFRISCKQRSKIRSFAFCYKITGLIA